VFLNAVLSYLGRLTLLFLLGVLKFCVVLLPIIFPQGRHLQATVTFAAAESWENFDVKRIATPIALYCDMSLHSS
jgi:hypothetical protein